MWLNGSLQWQEHILSRKHRKNFRSGQLQHIRHGGPPTDDSQVKTEEIDDVTNSHPPGLPSKAEEEGEEEGEEEDDEEDDEEEEEEEEIQEPVVKTKRNTKFRN